ncbi:DUF3987 domain-containing protein [Massilia sp. HP4]|uniref:DUF3987 domain-containing protein n=1 Tax=Massilia sp. HP4 TaxID=2562316 RepID=UPI0035A5FE8B
MNYKRPYPVNALPPLLAATVKELCANSSVQAELAAPLVLGVASLACQGEVDVARPNCEPSPCLLYTVAVSGSGSNARKTNTSTSNRPYSTAKTASLVLLIDAVAPAIGASG